MLVWNSLGLAWVWFGLVYYRFLNGCVAKAGIHLVLSFIHKGLTVEYKITRIEAGSGRERG